jgi:hypothetical protein
MNESAIFISTLGCDGYIDPLTKGDLVDYFKEYFPEEGTSTECHLFEVTSASIVIDTEIKDFGDQLRVAIVNIVNDIYTAMEEVTKEIPYIPSRIALTAWINSFPMEIIKMEADRLRKTNNPSFMIEESFMEFEIELDTESFDDQFQHFISFSLRACTDTDDFDESKVTEDMIIGLTETDNIIFTRFTLNTPAVFET